MAIPLSEVPEKIQIPLSEVPSEAFDPEGDGYDYASAIASGDRPNETGHWGSVDPRNGQILKGRKHETWNEALEVEQNLGNVVIKGEDGKYYSRPAPLWFPVERQELPGVWGKLQSPELEGVFSGRENIRNLLPLDVQYQFGKVVGMGEEPAEIEGRLGMATYYSLALDLPFDTSYSLVDYLNTKAFDERLDPLGAWKRLQKEYNDNLLLRTAKNYLNKSVLNIAENARGTTGAVDAITTLTDPVFLKMMEGLPEDPTLWDKIKSVPKMLAAGWIAAPEYYLGGLLGKPQRRKVAAEAIKGYRAPINFTIPPPKNALEYGSDVVSGVGAFVTQLLVAKGLVPEGTVISDAVAWEIVNRANDGIPGQGAVTQLALGGIGKVPTSTLQGKVIKTLSESGLFAGLTVVSGGDAVDAAVSALIPVAFNSWTFYKQQKYLENFTKVQMYKAQRLYQRKIQEGTDPAAALAHYRIAERAAVQAVTELKRLIYHDDAFAPIKDKWMAERTKALADVASGNPARVRTGRTVLDFLETHLEKVGSQKAREGVKPATTRVGDVAETVKQQSAKLRQQIKPEAKPQETGEYVPTGEPLTKPLERTVDFGVDTAEGVTDPYKIRRNIADTISVLVRIDRDIVGQLPEDAARARKEGDLIPVIPNTPAEAALEIFDQAQNHVDNKMNLDVVQRLVPEDKREALQLDAVEWSNYWQLACNAFVEAHPELTDEQVIDVVRSAFMGTDETDFEDGPKLASELHNKYLLPTSELYIQHQLDALQAQKRQTKKITSKIGEPTARQREAPAPQPATAKEPWEMTIEEYAQTHGDVLFHATASKNVTGITKQGLIANVSEAISNDPRIDRDTPVVYGFANIKDAKNYARDNSLGEDYEIIAIKKDGSYEILADPEYATGESFAIVGDVSKESLIRLSSIHEQAVEQAVEEGKPVRPKVIEEYASRGLIWAQEALAKTEGKEAQPATAKEPWEMTRRAWIDSHMNLSDPERGGFVQLPVTFIRAGDIPVDENGKPIPSKIGEGTLSEKGISVYRAWYDSKTGKYVLEGGGEQLLAGQRVVSEQDRPFYVVEGQVHEEIGEDVESLLVPDTTKVVKQISLDDIVLESDPSITLAGNDLTGKETPNWSALPKRLDHKQYVRQAVEQGKPVPRAVLEEYKSEKWAQEALARTPAEAEGAYAIPLTTNFHAGADRTEELAKLRRRISELARSPRFLTPEEEEELEGLDRKLEQALVDSTAQEELRGIRSSGKHLAVSTVTDRRSQILDRGDAKVIDALQAIDEYYSQENINATPVGKRANYIAQKFGVDTTQVLAMLYVAALDRLGVASGKTYVDMTSSMEIIPRAEVTRGIESQAEAIGVDPQELASRRLYAQLLLLGTANFNFTPLNDVYEALLLDVSRPGGLTEVPKGASRSTVISLESLADEIDRGELLITKKQLPEPLRRKVELSYERMAEVGAGHWPFTGARKLTGQLKDKPQHMAEDMMLALLVNPEPVTFQYLGDPFTIPASPLTAEQIEQVKNLEREAIRLNVDPFMYVWQNFLEPWEKSLVGDERVRTKPLSFFWDSALHLLNQIAIRAWEVKSEAERRSNPLLRKYVGIKYHASRRSWRSHVKIPGEPDKQIGSFKTQAEALAARRNFFVKRFGMDYQGFNLQAMPNIAAYPSYKDIVAASRSARLKPRMTLQLGTMEPTKAEDLLLKRHQGASYTGRNLTVRFSPGEYPPRPSAATIINDRGEEWYNDNKERNIQIVGRTYYDRDSRRLVCEVFCEDASRPRVLAEELYHPIFYVIRETDRKGFERLQEWFDNRPEFTGQSIDEAFAQEMSLIETGDMKPAQSGMPSDIIALARDIFAGRKQIPQGVIDRVILEFTDERFAIEEGGLILPEDIHRGEKGFTPEEKKALGLTRAEIKLYGKEFAALVHWAQLNGEKIGYKQGVSDKVETSRRAIDAMRAHEKIRNQNRVDAANLVFTYIPKEYRVDFMKRVLKVGTAKQVADFAVAIEAWVDEYEQRQLIREFKKFKGEVRRDSRMGETPFGQLPVHLAKQIDELLNSFDPVKLSERKQQSLESRQEWFSRMTSLLADSYESITAQHDKDAKSFFVIPPTYIEELRRLSATDIKDVSPDEIRWVIDQVRNLLSNHQAKGKSRWRRRWNNLHPRINQAWHQVQHTAIEPETLGAMGLFNKATTIGQSNMRTLIGYATTEVNDAVLELLYDGLVRGDHKRIEKYREFVEAWRDEKTKAKITEDDIKSLKEIVPVTIGGKQVELTRDDLLIIYGYTIADGTFRRLLRTEGLNITTYRRKGVLMTSQTYRVGRPTLAELREIAKLIPPAHKTLLDIHFKVNREHQAPAINEISIELENTEKARDSRYLSIHRETKKTFGGFRPDEMAAAAEMLGRFKPRTGGKLRMNIRSFSREVMTGLQADAFYYGMTIPMMDARSLLMNKDFVRMMKDNGHSQILNYIGTLYDRMQLYSNDQALLDQAFSTFWSKVGQSMLSARISGGVIQIASIPAAFGVIPRKHFQIAVPSKQDIDFLTNKYADLWLRWKARQFDFALGALTAQHAFGTMLFDMQLPLERLLNHYTLGDQFAVYNIYQAAVRMLEDEGVKPEDKGYEDRLRTLFDRAMETQPMWDAIHRSVITSDTGFFAKGFTWFMSARNAQLNVIQQAVDDAEKGRITKTVRNERIGNIVLASWLVAFLRALVKQGIRAVGVVMLVALGLKTGEDAEEQFKDIAKELTYRTLDDTVFNMMGLNVIGNVINAVAYGGLRASKYKWSGFDARYLRTGNLGVDLFTDLITTGIEGWVFAQDLLTLKKVEGKKHEPDRYAFFDSGERFARDMALIVAYRLGAPLEGPMSDIYYPLKKAYEDASQNQSTKKKFE